MCSEAICYIENTKIGDENRQNNRQITTTKTKLYIVYWYFNELFFHLLLLFNKFDKIVQYIQYQQNIYIYISQYLKLSHWSSLVSIHGFYLFLQ